MLLPLLLVAQVVRAFVPHISVDGYPWVTDVTPGLNWRTANDCGTEWILKVYYPIGEAQYLGQTAFNDRATGLGTPFEQFFGYGWHPYHHALYKDIFGNINASTWYPWYGYQKGRHKLKVSRQLSINCKERGGLTRCSQPGRATLAYVTDFFGEDGDQLTICPLLFNPSLDQSNRQRIAPRPLQDIVKGPHYPLGALYSYGQVMLHGKLTLPLETSSMSPTSAIISHSAFMLTGIFTEFMHVHTFKHPTPRIVDLEAQLPSCPSPGQACQVYGHGRCEEFAHLSTPNGVPAINPKVVKNADNYAWWATAQFFSKQWGIVPQKLRLAQDNTAGGEGDPDAVNILADDDFLHNGEPDSRSKGDRS